MNHSSVLTGTLNGVTGELAEIRAEIDRLPPRIDSFGLADGPTIAQRAWAAVAACGLPWPARQIQIRLRPSWTAGLGEHFDLPVAFAVLAATGQLPTDSATRATFGGLAEDGTVRPVRGILPLAGAAVRAGVRTVIVPAGNAAEAALAGDLSIVAVDSLQQLIGYLRGGPPPPPTLPRCSRGRPPRPEDATTPAVPWPLEVAVAGGHHLAIGTGPGAATPLVATLVRLLPDLHRHAAWDVTCLVSLAGRPHTPTTLSHRPPLQVLRPQATAAELVGHSRRLAYPGLLSMAHQGVLYLPCADQVTADQLTRIRSAHDHHQVWPPGGRTPVSLPARFQLVLATAPGSPGLSGDRTPAQRHQQKALARLLDRAHIHLGPPPDGVAATPASGRDGTPAAAARIAAARAAAAERWSGQPVPTNAQVPGGLLRLGYRRLAPEVTRPARRLLETGELTTRGWSAVVRIAWTIADLDGRDRPDAGDVTAACEMRREATTQPWPHHHTAP